MSKRIKNNTTKNISTVARASNIATIVTTTAHGYLTDNLVTVNAVNNGFDDTKVVIISAPTSTSFTYANTGSNLGATADAGTCGITINVLGQDIEPDAYTTLNQFDEIRAVNELDSIIDAATIVINDGAADLSAALGKLLINTLDAKAIGSVPIDTTNIANGRMPQYNSTSKKLEYVDGGASAAGTKGEVQVRGNSPGSFTSFTNFKWSDAKQSLQVGPIDNGLSDNPLDIGGNVNSWVQNNIKNSSAGSGASSDVICTKDTGSDNQGFIDVGINSSGYNTAAYNSGGPGDGYVTVNGGSLAIITETNHDIAFFTNGATTNEERVRIAKEGNLIVGRGAIATTATNGFLYLAGSAGLPTGVPTAYAGRVPITVDTTNNKIYYYSGGDWKLLANTKADLVLENVDNTSDATKNAAAVTLTNKTLTTPVINAPTGIVKADVGLANVDNTSDASKPVSTATQTALNLKANLASPTFTGIPAAPTPTTADNTTKIATTAFVKAQGYGKSIISTTLSDNTNSFSTTVATTYAVLGKFIYLGSTDMGALTKIYAIISQDSGGTTSIRIYDATNALTIAEVTGFNDTVSTIKDLGTISNLPTGLAIFEIQLKTSNSSKVVRISSVLAKV